MIDFRDLMIANLVYCPDLGRAIEVNSTTFNGHSAYLEGIEVTADMLKRIGFEEKKGICPKTFYRYFDKEWRYKLDVYPDFCNSDRKWSIHIDDGDCATIGCGEFTYIHELQNLVRVITGYDLPITKDMLYGLDDDA